MGRSRSGGRHARRAPVRFARSSEAARSLPFTCRNVANTLTAFFADCLAEEWVDLPANPMKHEAVAAGDSTRAKTLAGKHTIIHLTRPGGRGVLACEAVPEWRRVLRTLLSSHERHGRRGALRAALG